MAGLTSSGFSRQTFDQTLALLHAAVVDALGPKNTGPDSLLGQYDGIISEAADTLWSQAELVYQSNYPSSATGIPLDNVAQISNIVRLSATESVGQIILQGDDATVIPIGTQVSQTSTGEIFETLSAVTVSDDTASRIVLSINDDSLAPHTFDLITSAVTVSFSSALTVELDILTDLANQINASTYDASVNEIDLTLTIEADDKTDLFEITLISAGFDLDQIWMAVLAQSLNTGLIAMPVSSINNLISSVVGLNSVDNIILGVTGLEAETDDDFRVRRANSLAVVGAGTVPSISARIVNDIPNVTACTVIDNRTAAIDIEGRPPHSLEAIVTYPLGDTATELLISAKLFEVGGGGIETVGSVINTVLDSQSNPHLIRFSRPEDKYIWADIEITLFDEEIFPATGILQIQDSITAFGNALGAGQDCIIQRFFDSIYSVTGVENITSFKFGVTANPGDDVTLRFSPQEINAQPTNGEYNCTPANMETDGVVSGMIVSINPGNTLPDSVSTVNDTRFRSKNSIYAVSNNVIFGGLEPVNITVNGNAIARFEASRITVTVV